MCVTGIPRKKHLIKIFYYLHGLICFFNKIRLSGILDYPHVILNLPSQHCRIIEEALYFDELLANNFFLL